jgi:DnaD/phage-associated family protein
MPFGGFPAVARATAIPNVFFSAVLPRLSEPADLLAFLLVARLVQEQRGDARFVTADQVWAAEGAPDAFERLAGGREGLDRGLGCCVEVGALLAVDLVGRDGEQRLYFVNNPPSRRAVGRARMGSLILVPETVVRPISIEQRPDVFRLYEENVGTITPIVGERLIAAADEYPMEWIADAIREAVELNRRHWRYIERVLERWSQEGRSNETPGRDPVEASKQSYLGGELGRFVRSR